MAGRLGQRLVGENTCRSRCSADQKESSDTRVHEDRHALHQLSMPRRQSNIHDRTPLGTTRLKFAPSQPANARKRLTSTNGTGPLELLPDGIRRLLGKDGSRLKATRAHSRRMRAKWPISGPRRDRPLCRALRGCRSPGGRARRATRRRCPRRAPSRTHRSRGCRPAPRRPRWPSRQSC